MAKNSTITFDLNNHTPDTPTFGMLIISFHSNDITTPMRLQYSAMIINKMDSEDVDSLSSDTLPLPHVPSTSLERRRDTTINSGIISIPIDSLLSPKKHCTFRKHGGAQSQLSRRKKSEFELKVMEDDSDIESNSMDNKSRPQTAVNPRVAALSQVGSAMSGRGSPGSLTSLINYFKDKWRSLSSWKQEDEVEMDEVDSLTDSSDYSDHRSKNR